MYFDSQLFCKQKHRK